MRVDVSYKHMDKSECLENVVDKNIDKISHRVKIFRKEEATHISLHVEKNPHREHYIIWANLYLPRKVLKAQQSSKDVTRALNKVTDALMRQIDKHKIVLERHLQKQKRSLDIE